MTAFLGLPRLLPPRRLRAVQTRICPSVCHPPSAAKTPQLLPLQPPVPALKKLGQENLVPLGQPSAFNLD
jgi:hypothetical protein